MIQAIQSFEKYEDYIGELAGDPIYSDPHFTFDKDNLYRSLERQDEYAFAILENGEPEGLFVWLVIPEDRYIELNAPHSLMVVVDVDAKEEIELFTAAGFCKMEGQNSIAASYRLETV